MAEDQQTLSGPIMLSATSVLKQGPMRIGKISNDIVLPRTIMVKTLVFMIIYGLLGLVIGLIIGGLKSTLYSMSLGIALAYFATSYSPLKGETLSKFIGLSISSSLKSKQINGMRVKTYVGIVPISRLAQGRLIIFPGAVDIPPSNYDERGALIRRRRNIKNLKSGDE